MNIFRNLFQINGNVTFIRLLAKYYEQWEKCMTLQMYDDFRMKRNNKNNDKTSFKIKKSRSEYKAVCIWTFRTSVERVANVR